MEIVDWKSELFVYIYGKSRPFKTNHKPRAMFIWSAALLKKTGRFFKMAALTCLHFTLAWMKLKIDLAEVEFSSFIFQNIVLEEECNDGRQQKQQHYPG